MKPAILPIPRQTQSILVIESTELPTIAIAKRGGKYVIVLTSTETIETKTPCKR